MKTIITYRMLSGTLLITAVTAIMLLFQSLVSVPVHAAADTQSPTAPAGLSVANVTFTSISIKWFASKDNIGVKGYQIYRDGKKILSTSKTSYTNDNLIPGNKYTYFIKAYDASGNISSESTSFTASTNSDTQCPSQPTGVFVSLKTHSQITVAWNPSKDNISIKGYEVSCSEKKAVNTKTNYYTISRLQPGRSYMVYVKAYDIAGNYSMQSNSITVTTMADSAAPSVPTGIKAGTVSATEINLTWASSSDNVKLKSYEVYCDGEKVKSTSKTSYSHNRLTPGTAHIYTIRAIDTTGNASAFSSALMVTTVADTTAPNVPTSLKVKSATKSSASLVWTATKDNVKVKGYKIYWNGIQIAETTRTSYTVKIPISLGVDFFYVKAYDTSGNLSDKSSTVVAVSFS